MSGGSWDYVCYKVSDAANRLVTEKCPLESILVQGKNYGGGND